MPALPHIHLLAYVVPEIRIRSPRRFLQRGVFALARFSLLSPVFGVLAGQFRSLPPIFDTLARRFSFLLFARFRAVRSVTALLSALSSYALYFRVSTLSRAFIIDSLRCCSAICLRCCTICRYSTFRFFSDSLSARFCFATICDLVLRPRLRD